MGLPCIRGMRMPVASVLRMLGDGWTREQILQDWPELEPEDITECLRFASELASFRDVAA